MARGMPPRPAGGGAGRPPSARQQRSQPAAPRRGAGPDPRRRAAEQQRRTADQQRRTAEQQRRTAEQQRRTAEQQSRQRAAQQQRRGAAQAGQQRLRQQQYLREAHGARRAAEAEQRTEEIHRQVAELESILATGLQRSARIDLAALTRTPAESPFDPGPLATPEPEPQWEDFAPGGVVARWLSRARQEQRQAAARAAYQQARERWERTEQERAAQLADAEQAHQQRLAAARADAEAYRDRIARVAAGLRDRDPAVVESFLRTVLRRVPLPGGFPRRAEVSHHPDTEQVTVRMVLPGSEVVPEVSGYEYAAPADEIRPVPWPEDEADSRYLDVIAQVALLVVRDALEADPALAGVTFLGLVDDPDPDSDEPALPCLLRLPAGREELETLDLGELSPEEALHRLGARVSPDPYAHQPIPVPAGG